MTMFPSDRRYTKEHEWVLTAGTTATMGITDFAQKELGDIVYVELPAVGRTVAQGEVLGTIESVKAVSEIYAPISGTVAEVNGLLGDKPETINADPHGAGWICKLTVTVPAELDALLDSGRYAALAG
ncbi:MAG TPA: glycine cleavage system protein GcvH [Candidatus Polarisedimenticolaceae bacterium]|nr:glycine cleavage system protein GcvH [Candidatus Polarisedimenticolaceae bacterium]